MNLSKIAYFSAILLVLGIFSWPYGYFVMLRWIVCGTAIVLANKYFELKLNHWTVIFGCIALIFNPIFPVYLSKAVWVSIDFISAILFFLVGYSIRTNKQ